MASSDLPPVAQRPKETVSSDNRMVAESEKGTTKGGKGSFHRGLLPAPPNPTSYKDAARLYSRTTLKILSLIILCSAFLTAQEPNHKELLDQAQTLHQQEVGRRVVAESQVGELSEKVSQLETKVSELEAALESCQAQVPAEKWILHETFDQALEEEKWIFLCHDPSQNFQWMSPGVLDVVFIAGKTTGTAVSSGGRVLRSELEWRKGTTGGVPESLAVGKAYTLVVDLTIPADYNSAVSDKPNERRVLFQLWEASNVSPFAFELIKPSLPPWNGQQNILRIVAAGEVRWSQPVSPGVRYRTEIRLLLDKLNGRLQVTFNGAAAPAYVGPTCHGASPVLVPHFGLYLPGSDNDPVGGKTVIKFHEVGIK